MRADAAFQFVRNALESSRMAQAYIVVANPEPTGRVFARRVLQLLFCTEASGRPCGTCAACRHTAQDTHVDVLWVEPQKKSRQIGVDQIREVLQRVQQTAYSGGWKVCVIVAADRLGREAANAFLKTLEEPTANTLFLLLTDAPQTLLPTVISRCQTIAVEDLAGTDHEWQAQLLQILARAGSAAGGSALLASMARAEEMVALLKAMKETATDEVEQSADAEASEQEDETLDARASARYREWRTAFMRTMLLWYRDRLVLACGGDEHLLHFPAHREALRAQVNPGSRVAALRHVRTVADMHEQLERNLPEGNVFGYGLTRLI